MGRVNRDFILVWVFLEKEVFGRCLWEGRPQEQCEVTPHLQGREKITRLAGGVSSSQWATRVQLVRQGRGQRRTHTSESPCPSGAGVFVPLLRQHPGERPWGWGALSTPGPTCLVVGVGDLQQEDPQWSASTWTDVLRSGKGQGQGQSTDDISYSQEASPTQISCRL